MIESIIESYLAILVPIGVGSLLIFITGMYLICKSYFTVTTISADAPGTPIQNNEPTLLSVCKTIEPQFSKQEMKLAANDFAAISGEDVMATQLDLARAYIEAENQTLAKKILQSVAVQGNASQQEEAHHLLTLI